MQSNQNDALSIIWCDRARYVAQGSPAEIASRIELAALSHVPLVGFVALDSDDYVLAIDKISSIVPVTLDEARALPQRGR